MDFSHKIGTKYWITERIRSGGAQAIAATARKRACRTMAEEGDKLHARKQ